VFWLAGVNLATGERTRYAVVRQHWSVHYNVSPDQTRFAGDGGGPGSVPRRQRPVDLTSSRRRGALVAERLVDLSRHDYDLEPNVTFTPDGRWIVFRSNMHGASHVYAVDLERRGRTDFGF